MTTIRKYIHKANNRWLIQKHINGKLKSFKSFKKLDDAITYRNTLIQNNWQEPPTTPEEEQQKNIKKYYKYIHLNSYGKQYTIYNKKGKYLATTNTIEEALYYRDLYHDCPTPVPKPRDIDLTTDNPYILDGLMYPLPERLTKKNKKTKYGKGSIQQRSRTSYRVMYNKTIFATCRTYEQAYYVRQELQKCDWDKKQVPQILKDYPKWYTWLMEFYRYIIKDSHRQGAYLLNYPQKYVTDKRFDRISYKNLEDALFERDFLVEHNWDYDLLVYNIDDTLNPYYDMELPPYPERKVRNISERKTYTQELNTLHDVILDGAYSKNEAAEVMNVKPSNIGSWLRKYDTLWGEFVNLVLSGEDIWSVLELQNQYYEPDLSPSKPSNYTGYVHHTYSRRSPYSVVRKGVYYGAYKDKKTARRVVNELKKVDWDKSKLKGIQEKVGYEKFINTKRWVYEVNNGKSWMIRKKDKSRKMVNYGYYKDKRVAELVRDLLVENDWDKSRLDEFKRIAEEKRRGEGLC